MWIPKVTWKSFLACGLGGFRLVSRWCLIFLKVSRWCLHRLGMCSVAPMFVLCMWILTVTPWLVLCGSKDCFFVLCGFMWIPKVTWNSFLACGLGGFRLVSRWCLGLFASAVSRWCLHRPGMCSLGVWARCVGLFASAVSTGCLHRLGMCSVAPKIVLCGCFRLFLRWRERVFWFAVWAVFGSCSDDVWVFLHLQCLHGVCTGWACALWLQRLRSVAGALWLQRLFFLFSVDSKGDVKAFFGLRFRRFSARV